MTDQTLPGTLELLRRGWRRLRPVWLRVVGVVVGPMALSVLVQGGKIFAHDSVAGLWLARAVLSMLGTLAVLFAWQQLAHPARSLASHWEAVRSRY